MGLCYAEITESPLGPISLIAGDHGLQRVAFGSLKTLKQNQPEVMEEPSLEGLETLGTLLAEMNQYLFGLRKSFSIEIDWQGMSSFQRAVLRLACEIPYGEVRTYGGLAETLGKPAAARAVGKALGDNPMPILIPCHRIVDSTQHLRGYAAPNGIQTKAFLLKLEGHPVRGDRIVDENQSTLF